MQALWMVLAALLFATMSVCIKFASAHFGTMELVAYRGLIGMVVMGAIVRARGVSLATPVPWMHVWRSIVGVVSLAAWFFSIAKLPLATAMTLNYMSGIWVAAVVVGSGLLLGDFPAMVRQGPMVLTVLTGFGGVVMLLRPTLAPGQFMGALVGLASGLTAAFAYLQVSALGRVGEPETRTVFYFSVGAAIFGLLGMGIEGTHTLHDVRSLWLLPVGVLAALGQLCMTRAYSRGATLVVANLQYVGIVFSAGYGLWLFDDALPTMGWAGMVIIVLSGIAATALRSKARPSPADDH